MNVWMIEFWKFLAPPEQILLRLLALVCASPESEFGERSSREEKLPKLELAWKKRAFIEERTSLKSRLGTKSVWNKSEGGVFGH